MANRAGPAFPIDGVQVQVGDPIFVSNEGVLDERENSKIVSFNGGPLFNNSIEGVEDEDLTYVRSLMMSHPGDEGS